MMPNIAEQLTFVYLNLENWHKVKLNKEESNKYHERLLMQGNIITYVTDGVLEGYLEFYRINYEQLGRILCDIQLGDNEDLLTGNIAFINRMWIKEEFRNTRIFNTLGALFLERNKDAHIFATIQQHKHHKPFQVYTRDELIKFYK
jgi:hypothetical protein